MIGVLVNAAGVLIGGSIGLLAKKGIPENWSQVMFKGIALCVIYIGMAGSLNGENTLVLILSMAVGTLIGQGLDLDRRLTNLANGLEKRFKKEGDTTSVAEGFVTSSLLFCVGALTVVGSLQAGLTGNNEMLFTKSGLDFISAIIFASSLGYGVLFSAAFVLVFQGSIVLLAQVVAPFMGDAVIGEMTCAGSVLILGMGLNMLDLTKLKIMNYLPAIFLPIGFVPLYHWIVGLF
ncbi:MAG: DUF554 domain-containing protein [Anaerovoracaceae bacterium]|jgi:uncharacterized membrane protein YqgA involved in biofilm formation